MRVRKEIQNNYEKIMKIRRDLHRIPEEGYEENKTSAYIQEQLKGWGYEPQKVAKTGVVAFIEGQNKEKTIAFRADMDGLSVREKTGCDFVSLHPDFMHACGHDGHMSILLGLAGYLKEQNIKPYTNVLLIFQPAEEGPGGAQRIIEEGIFDRYPVDEIYGIHMMPQVEEGIFALRPGAMMAQTGEFTIRIRGKSAHGASPHEGIDSIVIAASVIQSLQTIVSRSINPIDTSLITVGTVQGGERVNVIAHETVLTGTMRAYRESVYEQLKKRMAQVLKGTETMHSCEITCEVVDMYPPVVNDEKLYQKTIALLGQEEYESAKPMMIAEDFSYYQRKVPGLFLYLGSYNEEKNYVYGLHDGRFNFDEKILLHGVELYMRLIEGEKVD